MTDEQREKAEQRRDREAVSLDVAVPVNAAVAANVLSDHSFEYANAEQDVSIDRDDQRR